MAHIHKKNSNPYAKVYLTGGDSYYWALDEDLRQTRAALTEDKVTSSLEQASIIHSVYWETLKKIPDKILKQKYIVCNLSGEWERYEKDFNGAFLRIAGFVDIWVVRSQKAKENLERRGENCFFIPYTVDTDTFTPNRTRNLQRYSSIPRDKYIIGNFMRDTQGGRGQKPKLVKGPDIFSDIVTALYNDGQPIHVLLAGPRRHWLRKALKQKKVPFTYIGWPIPFDDMRINTLNRKKLNALYNQLNLSLVCSRSEAGPHAILEAAASECPQISTPVGIAPDILNGNQIYESTDEAIKMICDDIKNFYLVKTTVSLRQKILDQYTPNAVCTLYDELYERALK